MANHKAKLTQGGRMVIPAEYRRAVGLDVGDEVVMRIEGGEIRLTPLHQSIKRAQEMVRRYVPKGRSLAKELIAERKEEKKRE
ncbi:MAG: AbrB/MazE/SpoVT family DNA-binding domain-containing protein [Gammaproteobacteria bacterium]|jgi:looped-hinge helix DNA binding domain, AbrB family|nr:AbrB/MazE/SpoVT family DNA-binding domain-containing protein [Gammaproteobacteria bacterium]